MFDLQNERSKNFGKHRSGWSYAVDGIQGLHCETSPKLISFIEKKFIFGSESGDILNQFEKPVEPWVGFLHIPENVPTWFNYHYSPNELSKKKEFKDALKLCEGIYTLSSPSSDWVKKNLNIPTCPLLHPTELVEQTFNSSCLDKNKINVVQLGFWLRKLHAINQLDLNKKYFQKIMVGTSQQHQQAMLNLERKIFNFKELDPSILQKGFMNDNEYDELLANSVVFVDFYDTSANNAIVEAIARGTPIICPPNKAVIDYLGMEYPLYFNSYEHAVTLLNDKALLKAGHDYLLSSGVRNKLTIKSFIQDLEESKMKMRLK